MKNIKDFAKELSLDVKTIEKLTREAHQGNKYILEFDLKNFFPNIKFWDIRDLFLRMKLNNKISLLFAKLCTYNKRLPQGAIISPYISNLICYDLDLELLELCNDYDITYTRYADDLTFSSDSLYLLFSLMKEISDIIRSHGFKINYEKTKMLYTSDKQIVTGITINNGIIKADKKLKRMIRAKLYYGVKNNNILELNKLIGYIAYVTSIESDYKLRLYNYFSSLLQKFNREDSWGLLKILNK